MYRADQRFRLSDVIAFLDNHLTGRYGCYLAQDIYDLILNDESAMQELSFSDDYWEKQTIRKKKEIRNNE
jgi:hypothetical protein